MKKILLFACVFCCFTTMSYGQKQQIKKKATTDASIQEKISQYPLQKDVKPLKKKAAQLDKSALVATPNAKIKPKQEKKAEQKTDAKQKQVLAKKVAPEVKKEARKKVMPTLSNE